MEGMITITTPTGLDKLVEIYQQHLKDTAGLSPGTRLSYERSVREFLATQYRASAQRLDLRLLSTPIVLKYLTTRGAQYAPASLQRLGAVLRSFFRFLVLTGCCRQTQVPTIPAIRTGGRPSLPDYLSGQELARLLGVVDRRTKQGLRDDALTLCLAKLGLRAGEVAG